MENPKDNKKDNSTKGKKDKMDERVKNLFAEQDPPSYASIREVDAMKARIAELEEKLAQQEMAAAQKPDLTDTAEEVTANQDGSQQVETPATETEPVITALEPATGRFKFSSIQSGLGKAVKAGLSWLPANLVAIITITMMVLVAAWSITSGSVTALFNISNWKTLSTQVILLLVLAVVVFLLLGFFLVRQFRAYPLRARLTASFLILTIVPLAIVGRQTYLSTYEILEGQIQNEILRSSITTSSEFQDFFTTQFNTMRIQARSSELVAYLQTPEAVRAGSEQETLALEKLKAFTKNKSVYIMSYALVDLNGINVLDTNKTKIGTSYAGQEFFDYVKTNETVYASGLIMSPDGDRTIYLAAPISSSGELVGVFVATLQPKYVQETIELLLRNNRGDLSQLATEHTYIIDGDNYFVLGHSIRKDLLYKTYLSPNDPKLTKLVELGVDPERLNRLVDYQPEILAGLSGMTDTSIFEAPGYDGSLTQSAAVRLPDSNWIVVTARNVDTISGAIQNQTRTNVTTSIFIIAFVALFALVASRFFTRPIIELTNVAESISAGDLTKKAAVRGNDEIGVLARTFNTMTEQIQTLVTGLEKRVQDRTHDLELATDVGSAVAEKTGDLNELLTEAVKLIRARYELYYTQVYLLDGAGRYLVLRAGTGEIGEALLRRGHRLAVSANSLNSRAVSSQKPVLVGDTQRNENFLPNPLLPLTRSELAVPLISNGKVVGVLDMQSDAPDTFNESNLSAFQILSGQLAIAIQNSLLFNEMNEARLQVEEQSRRLTSSGWQDFLNAVERSETIGYEFNQTGIQPLADSQSMPDDHALTVPIMVAGSNIGEVQIADDKTRVWSLVEAEIIESVVSRVAQHIETLRLLAQAERYRHQAEDVSRRLTVEGWNEYFRTRREVADGFRYDRDKVQPLNGNGDQISEVVLTHPLVIHNQPVGMMMVDTQNGMDADTTELVAAVAERLSDHIENLRLLEETQEQRVQLSEALNIAKLGYWEYDLERDKFTFNDQFYSLFRTTAKQVGGYELSSADYARLFVHPEDAPLVGIEIERALSSTDRFFTAKVEHRAIFPGGEIGYVSVDINLERDENGKITRWYGANQDITERKKAELAVVESEKRLQSILTSLPISILISRISDGQLMYYNEAFTKLFGYQESDLTGKATPDLYYETQDRDILFTELRKRGSLTGYELRNKHSDGHLIWTLLNVFPIRYGDDDCLLIGAVDVTQRKKIEETMSKRANQLETVAVLSTTTSTVLEPDALLQEVVNLTKERFDLYHAHIYLTDDDASNLSLSAGAGKIGEEMVGKGHSISTDAEKSLVARAFRERRAILVNDTASQPDFLPNPLLPNTRSEMAVPMIVGDTVLGVFDVQSDVADGFTREDANIYTTLASQVAVALQNARLYMEQAATVLQLRELDRLKSAFLANMSHELRTPLNSILGFTDVMLEGLDGDLTEYMDNDLRLIQKNGRHLLHLINDVLDMAKIESGRMNLHPETFRVHELLEEVFSITAPLASEKNLSLLIEEDSDSSIEVYADNTRIRQVMINLVNNSIKFTERGKISLSVKLIDGARALIAIKDTGIGIPKDHLESVFYEFTQVDTSTTRKVGGTGLGLPISRRLIEMHGGRLWAESTGVSGEGSTFFVELPLEAQVSDVIEKQESEA